MTFNGGTIDELIDAVERVALKLKKCPDCEFEFPQSQLVRCKSCEHISCACCMEDHALAGHADDISNSPEAHGAWRRYDA